jgi:hypothetical protein
VVQKAGLAAFACQVASGRHDQALCVITQVKHHQVKRSFVQGEFVLYQFKSLRP